MLHARKIRWAGGFWRRADRTFDPTLPHCLAPVAACTQGLEVALVVRTPVGQRHDVVYMVMAWVGTRQTAFEARVAIAVQRTALDGPPCPP